MPDKEPPYPMQKMQAIGSLIALILSRIVLKSDWATDKRTLYHHHGLPNISIKDYIDRFVKHTKPNEAELICLLIYIERYTSNTKQTFNILTAHRIIAAAFITAQKICDDDLVPMSDYAAIAGISLKALNKLERAFLNDVDYALFVTREQYFLHKEDLVLKARKYEKKGLGPYPLYIAAEKKADIAPLEKPNDKKAPAVEMQKANENSTKKHFLPALKPSHQASSSSLVVPLQQPTAVIDNLATSAQSAAYNPRFTCKSFHLPPLKPAASTQVPQCH